MTTLILLLYVVWVIGIIAIACLACWLLDKIITAIIEYMVNKNN